MGKVVIYKGQSQYDVLRIFADQLTGAFQSLGKDVDIVDFLAPDSSMRLQEAFAGPIELVIAFNAIGIDFRLGAKSLYDAREVPFVAIMVDHPVYHLQRLEQEVENLIIACVDRSHVNFINNYFSFQKSSIFLPHGGCYVSQGSINPNQQPRDIDVLFGGSFADPDILRNLWNDPKNLLTNLLNDIADFLLTQDCLSIEEGADQVLAARGIYLSYELTRKFILLLPLVDKYIRAYRRLACLKTLARSGLKVEIYGSNWESAGLDGNFIIHQAISFPEMLNLMQRARIVLNIGPNFPDGSHERVFSAMLNGAVAVSDYNKFYAQEFVNGENIILYSWTKLDTLPDQVAGLLSRQDKLNEIALAGRRLAIQKHTWLERAQTILQRVDIYKGLKPLKVH
ncbi:glycosyltransferase [Moorella naiadis]|uniref:glycosyltransferase family protein n=1 Tax=Moorella naiadis (nom. illeg.) TaxID=3093670 RepID=UPI003D9CB297